MKKTRQILIAGSMLTISLVAGLLIVESLVRFLDLAPPLTNQYGNNVSDQYLPFKPKPLSVSIGRSSTDEFDFRYEHNSFGFRDIEHQYEKEIGTVRILGLGDSFTYGIGADFEESYLYQLEEMLNSRQEEKATVEIIKAGIPRFFPEVQRILLEKYGVLYSPDIILVGFLPNDVVDTYVGVDAVVVHDSGYLRSRESEQIGEIGFYLYENSHFIRMILKTYISFQISRKYPTKFGDVYKEDGFHEKDWVKVEEEYTRIVSIAKSIGSEVVFVHIPQAGPWKEAHTYPAKRLSEWASENGARFIDVLPPMKEASLNSTPLYFEKDGHCTPAGYHVVAETIYKYIIDSGILP